MAIGTYSSPKASGLPKDSVIEIAEHVSTRLGYSPGKSLEPIVDRIGGRISYQDFWDLEMSASGSIKIHAEADFDIYLASHTGPLRDRFTTAHELGHYVLHFLIPVSRGDDVQPLQATRYGSGRVEREANWFAAGFLMPQKAFARAFHKHERDITAIAEEFCLSQPAVVTRARSLSLLT